jgi:hypothetical protein
LLVEAVLVTIINMEVLEEVYLVIPEWHIWATEDLKLPEEKDISLEVSEEEGTHLTTGKTHVAQEVLVGMAVAAVPIHMVVAAVVLGILILHMYQTVLWKMPSEKAMATP